MNSTNDVGRYMSKMINCWFTMRTGKYSMSKTFILLFRVNAHDLDETT